MKHLLSIITLSLAFLALASCGENTGKPASSDRPYQVLLVGDRDDILYNELTDTVPGLPQPEPRFDVTIAKEEPGSNAPWQKLSRSIVCVVFDKQAKETHMALKRDVYAKPQAVLTITTPSVASLRKYINARRGSICRILEAFEMGCQMRTLKAHHNEKFDAEVKRMFGINILIPVEMQSSKHGKDFLWLSNNQNEGLQNICLYRVKTDNRSFQQVRDSVMKINIPGEKDGMYMETATPPSPPVRGGCKNPLNPSSDKNTRKSFQHPLLQEGLGEASRLFYGLWDMHNDAMGGPFVAIALQKPPYIIYIEGFVYAPESKKRNKIRQLEAVLYSASMQEKR